ncbi:MAG: SAM-dependent methyltransferase [Spirochaetes bacterium]|nr:SAM-dependent methyltransferase [Spirochaetota bacterium]
MREVRDHYYKKAKAEQYRARSVYKLMEIDRKFHLLRKGFSVLDIGCSPGSWSQYVLEHVENGHVTGIDLAHSVDIRDSRFTFIQADILDKNVLSHIGCEAGDRGATGPFDLIVSDAAPKTTGNKFTDSQNSLRLVRAVFEIAKSLLRDGGSVVSKVFQGEDLQGFVDSIRKDFGRVDLFKPKSSRAESRELYIIARNRGGKR